MSKIYTAMEQLVGHTPLIELTHFEKALGLKARLLAKVEAFNPAGSAKDRVALSMIREAEASGALKPGGTIIESTSGNTGIGLCAFAVPKGYRVIIVMPECMSLERRLLLAAYGAELVLTDASEGMAGANAKAAALAEDIPGAILAGQMHNLANPKAHFLSTGPEIWEDTDGEVDFFVAGVGTGGTITGTGEYLKSKNPNIKVIAMEPAGSPWFSKGISGPHGLQGIGAGITPDIVNTDIWDEIITVTDDDAYQTGRRLSRTEGILAGITSGAALWAAIQVASREENAGKTVVALLPDTGERYLSTPLYHEGAEPSGCH